MVIKPRTREVRTIEEFMHAVMRFSDWDQVLFRGQRRADWDLVPNLARVQLRTHRTLRDVEVALVKEFRRQCTPYVNRAIPDAWEELALAQHHGLSTRLLDWSANPLAALWFAVKDPALEEQEGVVLMIALAPADLVADREKSSPFTIRKTKFFQPSHLTPRIIAQAGWFSVHYWSSANERFSRLDRISAYRKRIERLTIPADSFAGMRADLDRLGINYSVLFPDIDGLTRHLNWSHGLMSDEEESSLSRTVPLGGGG